MNRFFRFALCACFALAGVLSEAAVPQTINYQGYLTNSASLPVNTPVNMTFRLYAESAGGAPIWQETQSGIAVSNGVFNIALGSMTTFGLPFDAPYFLGVQVNTDPEMSPRQPLSVAPYALRALTAEALAPAAADIFFKQGGNNFGGTAVLGSTNDGVEIMANNVRAVRIQPDVISPNIALGHQSNVAGDFGISGATVSGGGETGFANRALGFQSTVSGGRNNVANAQLATVGGGNSNAANGPAATVAGGNSNIAAGNYATISGGFANGTGGSTAAIGGGSGNNANGVAATVGGGDHNTASGSFATVPGGANNSATGNYSFAAGHRAIATNSGCFVWGDSTEADINCTFTNAFSVRASGGVYLRTNATLSTGCDIPAGGGAWACTSSRETKKDFSAMNPANVLKRLVELPVTQWRYQTEVSGARHLGPMAEDFYAAFGLGDSDKTISVIDASGVALAAIQGLYKIVAAKNEELDLLKRELREMKKQLGLK